MKAKNKLTKGSTIRTFWSSVEFAKSLEKSLRNSNYVKAAIAYIFNIQIFHTAWTGREFSRRMKNSVFFCDLTDYLTVPSVLSEMMGYKIQNGRVVGNGGLAKVFAIRRASKLHAKVIGCYSDADGEDDIFCAYYGSSNLSSQALTTNTEVNARISGNGTSLVKADKFLSDMFRDGRAYEITKSKLEEYLHKFDAKHKVGSVDIDEPDQKVPDQRKKWILYDHTSSISSILGSGYFRLKETVDEATVNRELIALFTRGADETILEVVFGKSSPVEVNLRKSDTSCRFDSVMLREYIVAVANEIKINNRRRRRISKSERIELLDVKIKASNGVLYVMAKKSKP